MGLELLVGKDIDPNEFHIICDITNPKLNDLPSVWQPSSSYISQDNYLKSLFFFMVNNTADSIEFLPGEILGELEIMYTKDVIEFNAFNVCSRNQ